ncbi:MAG TPA: sigma-70 family RNA polymerase sigma factor [Thermoflexia bacterium]|jgi:RNA polymerase sigma-70 factor (ECF subfamily)|nr:sigma-70 family RNA polymerase sigma factor [Thermoflexia bacterium]
MDEALWIQQARAGNVEAFGRLVRAYQTAVYNLAYRMLGNRMEAEDAAQETFLRAFQHLDQYDPDRPFRTWLLSIAAHHCIDRMRRQKLTLPLDSDHRDGGEVDPEEMLIRKEAQEAVQRLLHRLPPTDRAVVILYYWYGESIREIAQTVGLTVSAVKSRLHRARWRMAQGLEIADGV